MSRQLSARHRAGQRRSLRRPGTGEEAGFHTARGTGQPLVQLRPAPASRGFAHRDGDRLLLADQHRQPLSPRDPGLEQVPPQHGVVLGQHRDHHGRILRTLALVERRGIGRHQRVQLAETVNEIASLEPRGELARLRVHIGDEADVAVVNLLVVVVLDLHHLVAGGKGPAEALDLPFPRRVEGGLELDVERAGAGVAVSGSSASTK